MDIIIAFYINEVLFQNVLFLFRYFKCLFRCSAACKRLVVEPFLLARTLEKLGMSMEQAEQIIKCHCGSLSC